MQQDYLDKVFGREGLIAKFHERYEYREGQVAMAGAVTKAFEEKRHLLVEAGTGTGKSFGALVPALARRSHISFPRSRPPSNARNASLSRRARRTCRSS